MNRQIKHKIEMRVGEHYTFTQRMDAAREHARNNGCAVEFEYPGYDGAKNSFVVHPDGALFFICRHCGKVQ